MAEIVDFGLQQHKIKMDSRYFENVLSVVAGDTGRRIEVQLLDTNGTVQDTTGLNLRLNAVIAGKATYTNATLVDAATGKYQLDLSNGMFLAPGNWQFQWQITDSAGKKLHSFAFAGNVGSNISEGGSQATNFYLNLDDLKAMQEDLVNGTFESEALETNIAEKLEALEETYAPKLTEVTAQLAEKASKGEVNNLVSSMQNGVKGIYLTLSDLQTNLPNGSEGNYIVQSDGHIYNWNGSVWVDTEIQYQSTGIAKESVGVLNLDNSLVEKEVITEFDFENMTSPFPPESQIGRMVIPDSPITAKGSIVINLKIANDAEVPVFLLEKEGSNFTIKQKDVVLVDEGENQEIATGLYSRGTGDEYVGIIVPNDRLLRFGDYNGIGYHQSSVYPLLTTTIGDSIEYTTRLNATFAISFSTIKIKEPPNDYISLEDLPEINRWTFKKANFLGDSITAGTNTTKTYLDYLKEVTPLEVTRNYGIGGSRISGTSSASMHVRALEMDNDADLVCVFGGTNDFNLDMSLGEFYTLTDNGIRTPNYDTMTFYGALHQLCKNLMSIYTGKQVVLITPIHREHFGTQHSSLEPNDKGIYLDEYVEAIKKIGEWYSIPVLDLYAESGLQPNVPENKEVYFTTTDGLHPNEAGHRLIAEKILAFLNTI